MALSKTKLVEDLEDSKIEDEPVVLSLVNYVRSCYAEAKSAKADITERLLKCERQRRGEYDPDRLAMIRDTGGSDIYMMLTDIKCRASESWIKDVMMNAGEKSWSLRPTAEPSVPDYLSEEIVETVVAEAEDMAMQEPLNPQVIQKRLEEVYNEVRKKLDEKSYQASERMEKRIMDKMQDSKFDEVLSEFIYDFVTFPCAIMKAPLIRQKKKLKWAEDFKAEVVYEIAEEFERVSPYDIFPSPNANNCQEGYLIQRHQLTRADIESFKGLAHFDDEAINQVLEQYGRSGITETLQSDAERNNLEGRNTSLSGTELIEGIEFWGSVSGGMLEEWGMEGVETYKEYEVNVWVIGQYVIKAILNPDPLCRRPYSKASWEQIPSAFWGLALPEMMRDVQTVCNASARALANNMALASAPQVEVTVDRLPDGEDITQMYPWKIWQVTSDRTGGGQPAVRFYQPNMNADVLMSVYQYFQKQSDEVTGVPNYVYGSSQVSGAGRTASGLAMLMENASKGIKSAILNVDGALTEVLQRMYDHLMIYDPDPAIKGDMQIVPAGVVGTLLRESVQVRRNEFLQLTSNPVDIQIMGASGRAELLRETAKGLNMDIDKLIPDPEELKEQEEQQKMMQMMMAQQQQGGQVQ